MVYTFNCIIYLLANLKNINSKQNALAKDMLIIYFFIDSLMDLGTRYKFREYYYFKGKVILLLSTLTDIVYFNTCYSVTLYNITFFHTQSPNTLI